MSGIWILFLTACIPADRSAVRARDVQLIQVRPYIIMAESLVRLALCQLVYAPPNSQAVIFNAVGNAISKSIFPSWLNRLIREAPHLIDDADEWLNPY